VTTTTVAGELRARFGDAVLDDVPSRYLADMTEGRGVRGRADAVALPRTPDEVASIVAWCYEQDVAIVPRGGGTGYAAGAVPVDGGVVISLERLARVRSFDPLLWRIEVEAGVTTAEVRRLARENGLYFPPDPGASEQSQIGGNVATNAGGPHAFKYGVTGAWVTGLEAVVAPGELVRVGGPQRKDVAGYDLKSLLIGSEGTLGVVTGVWLKLIPAPEAAAPVASFHDGIAAGCAALERVVGSGIPVAALDYLDPATVELSRGSFPGTAPEGAFMILAEVDGSAAEVERLSAELIETLGEDALAVHAPASPTEVAALWRWREGLAFSVQSPKGGKWSEDIAVPFERLVDAVEETLEIGRRHGLHACSWGHAGDGNVHSTFLVAPESEDDLSRGEAAAEELLDLAVRLGGTISGEHGVGWLKRGRLARQWAPGAVALHEGVKRLFDPKGLFNPGKKAASV
jgi:glycolate oxidase subunit GlcD